MLARLASPTVFIVLVIMLNILIAVVSDSYECAIIRSKKLFLSARLELVAEFDPRSSSDSFAVFEATDAYYIPVHGFDAVSRPGPRVRVYRFR